MTPFELAFPGVIQREGPESDVRGDPGGRTRYGIAENEHPEMWREGPPTYDAAEAFYRRLWNRLRLDDVAASGMRVAEKVFDIAVNIGETEGGMFLQRGLNAFNRQAVDYPDLVVDGRIGLHTIGALRAYTAKRRDDAAAVLHECLACQQGTYYLYLARQDQKFEDFEFGWFLNRVML